MWVPIEYATPSLLKEPRSLGESFAVMKFLVRHNFTSIIDQKLLYERCPARPTCQERLELGIQLAVDVLLLLELPHQGLHPRHRVLQLHHHLLRETRESSVPKFDVERTLFDEVTLESPYSNGQVGRIECFESVCSSKEKESVYESANQVTEKHVSKYVRDRIDGLKAPEWQKGDHLDQN